jgi:hypothetical protein
MAERSMCCLYYRAAGIQPCLRRISAATPGGANAWTDAYLAALAAETGATIATFDRRLPKPVGSGIEILTVS